MDLLKNCLAEHFVGVLQFQAKTNRPFGLGIGRPRARAVSSHS